MKFGATGILCLGLCFVIGSAEAQTSETLASEISKADAELFDAFNACDLETMGKIFSMDLEFYHDVGGLGDYKKTMGNSKANCERGLGLKRELVDGSQEVYPIADYGAIQKGSHTFCHVENGEMDCGTFEFVHVWRRDEGSWKVARVISYGH